MHKRSQTAFGPTRRREDGAGGIKREPSSSGAMLTDASDAGMATTTTTTTTTPIIALPPIRIHQHAAGSANAGTKSPAAGRAAHKKYTEAERIEKHRAVVRRGYYQKKALKAQLRQELGVLEEQYRAVMAQSSSPPTSPPDWAPHCAGCEHVESLRQRFKEQVLETEALRRENETLERRLWQHTDFLDKLQWYLTRQAEEERLGGLPPQPQLPQPSDDPQRPQQQRRASLTTTRRDRSSLSVQGKAAPNQGPASFPPLTESECMVIAQSAQRDICSQRRCPGFRDIGPPVMGWNRKHKFGETSKFSLLKRFYGRRASALAARAWELYATTELLGQLYSGGTNVRFDVLQRVDADNMLLRRVMQTEELARPKTTYFLMARRVAPVSYVDGSARQQQQILFRSVDTERIPTSAAEFDGWLDMFYWLCFDDCEGDHGQGDDASSSNNNNNSGAAGTETCAAPFCQVEFGGHVPCISVADTAFWTMEFLSYILRLENYAVDSVFNINL